jgi:DNA-binding NtrC family response regulator
MAIRLMIGRSAAHTLLVERLSRLARVDIEVLITGPTGVGKELYARFVHQRSHRANRPFVAVNCGALPNELFENELFGHIGGAFTGARPQSPGLVAEAEGGTLFLDEVDSLSLANQVKLLRFIQEKEYRKLGDTRPLRANVRIIAATNADLLAAVRENRFREDLFFRLRVVPVEVPPLCDRAEDISPLIDGFVAHYADFYRMNAVTFTAAALERMHQYLWPGNIRELENCIRYLTCLALERPVEADELPLLPLRAAGESVRTLRDLKRELVQTAEREYLETALRATSGNIAAAARSSGKARRAFFELMRKHGIKRTDFGQGGARKAS